MKFMDLVANVFGDRIAGILEYNFRPKLRDPWGSGFNGQQYRQQIFKRAVEAHASDALIETGTCRGSTTEFLLKTGLPVYTSELSPRFYTFAQRRLAKEEKVHMYLMDSRSFLKTLIASEDANKIHRPFCYLDAHWYDDLPLREEIELIFSRWDDAVILVDDFEVPGTQYGFDDYGGGNSLTISYLEQLQGFSFKTFFPAEDEKKETGGKRGCIVLANSESTAAKLVNIPLLKQGPDFPQT